MREINFEYQEFLNKFYKTDKGSIKKWMNEQYGDYFNRKLEEVTLDKDMIIVKDQTQKELIEDAVCSICLGVVRLPAKMCNHCSKIFCQICVSKINGMAGLIDNAQVDANNIMMIEQDQEIKCPCCKKRTQWGQLSFPRFMKNQIENFEFKCKKKNCK